MIDLEQIHDSIASTPSKIVLLVADGLGGLPHPDTRKSELETAHIPNLDALAQRSACGLTTPVEVGVAPGSGPGTPRVVRIQPVEVPYRARRAGGPRDRSRIAARRRGRARQLLHRGR